MSTWKQEIAEAVTPIEGVNAVTAHLIFEITLPGNDFSPVPNAGGTVRIFRTVQVKGLKEVDARLVDGKNYTAEDFITEIAYTKYLEARKPLPNDPPIINNGVSVSLENMRPINENYGIRPVEDKLSIAGEEWNICDVQAFGLMDDDTTGEPVPAKLRFVLRK